MVAAGVAVGLDEDGARRAAGQGLETHGSRAGVQVEHRGAVHRSDQVEGGLAHAVARRPRVRVLRRVDRRALPGAGDDAQGVRRLDPTTQREHVRDEVPRLAPEPVLPNARGPAVVRADAQGARRRRNSRRR